ncbi:transglutaminaseTgpA domain-containing protein [Hydrogenophaga defluvii]|uniref:TransglutaminaseTgpA domain-containing protein n=1 Tax=Hydrogenophaga defluvii TaxID=249410 RepID=A0ABW2SF11_9BURK
MKPLNTTLAGLPREVRDTLFLLAVIGWVVLMQAAHIPPWCLGLTAALLGWRAYLTVRLRPLPGLWTRVALLALAVGATYATHRTILGRDAGVTLIVVLLALKTLELRARRDAFVVFFLSFFTLLTHFFYSQSLLTAVGILLALWGLLTALVNAHMPVGHPPLWSAARLAGGMALLGAPIMLVLFMLFPRMAPLWGIPSDGMTGRSGLSPTMSVGSIASLALDDSIVMRLRFDGRPPPQRTLYFRGPVLSRFDGRTWQPAVDGLLPGRGMRAPVTTQGSPVRYQVTLEPSNRPWLLVLDTATETPTGPNLGPQDLVRTPDLQWLLRRPVTDLLRYEAQSFVDFQYGPQQAVLGLQEHVDLPPGFNPRTLALAQSLRQNTPSATPQQLVEQALERLRTGGYTYTLEPGLYGEHTADEFWFDRKAGFCEHIASSFVVLMRALDIPARIVTGYQGGEVNSVDGFWTVRQSDAHAWAEVWLAGRGWVRVDPTSSVAPGRTGTLQRLRPEPGLLGAAMLTVSPDMAARLRALWEAANNSWNQWVLNYTQSRQFDLLRRLGLQATDWTDLLHAMVAVVVGAAALGALWTLWERHHTDPWLRQLERARARLRREGVTVPFNSTPRQLAQLLPTHLTPEDRAERHRWLMEMEAQRYRAASASGQRKSDSKL